MLERNNRPKRVEEKMTVADWPQWAQEDIEKHRHNPCVGGTLVSEGKRARVWQIWLQPGERLPFHRHVLDYFWTVTSAGRSRSYYEDGKVVEIDNEVGDTAHLHFGKGEYLLHDLNNVGDTVLGFVTVEFLESDNEPLPLPEGVKVRSEAA
jgi:beta-alanine degradation protein BauB